ncbi:hypothetical protein PF327_09855 [Sulfurovum sp. XTW-4]|uniref:Fibronectin type-III domain-containing protein n=1 Tax=Sulfurovum xiamenensis TaxID=3019066 RepID=A0ABT7QU05_9BACT|nr:hypothetical protein [Sulfurovum xiamenensis]MDM5264500.1 hypothetical protein [Sulfurovum xiamenensis]
MKMIQSRSKKFVSIMAVFFAIIFGIMVNGCGGGGGTTSTTPTTPTVEAPGIPTSFAVQTSAVGGVLSAELIWQAPTTGGAVDTYELYKYTSTSTTPNHLISLPATADGFTDNAGLDRCVITYYVLGAKNAGGETRTLPIKAEFSGCGTGEVDAYGNNMASALIFADGIGISEEVITGVWTEDNISLVDYNTGLRPVIEENASELPYFDVNTTYVLGGVTYYKQKTISTWQGEWIDGSGLGEHNVTAKWGDNLISQTLTTQSVVRIEMVFTKALDTNMTAYNMVSLYGEKDMEIYGTDGNTTSVDTAFVFTAYAGLKIERLDALGGDPVLGGLVDEQTLFDGGPDGPGQFAAEINVAGNLVYGYVWDLPGNNIPAGAYRITFTLGQDSNVIIGDVAVPDEGENPYTTPVLDSPTQVHIDIIINE